jgi:hypothetical protein
MSLQKFFIMPSALGPMRDGLPCYTPLANHETEVHVLPLVLASDYDSLHVENQRLREAINVALTTGRGTSGRIILDSRDEAELQAALTTANGEGE